MKLFCKKVVLDEEEMVEGDAEDSSDEEQGVGITPPPPTFVNLRHLLRVCEGSVAVFDMSHWVGLSCVDGTRTSVTQVDSLTPSPSVA